MCRRGDNMPFNQTEYISNFNKNNYKMYQFRVKKSDINIRLKPIRATYEIRHKSRQKVSE